MQCNTEYGEGESQTRQPTIEQIMEWESDGGCEATDGCWVEPDGFCPHGCPSWMLELGLV